MSDSTRRIGFLIRKRERSYKIGTLFWRPEEESLYLALHRTNSSLTGTVGKFEAIDGRWSIPFSDTLEDKAVLHSSVHASGVSHVRLSDAEDLGREEGVPLRDLRQPRPLWTITARIADDSEPVASSKKDDFIIEEPAELQARVLYLIAFPHGSHTLTLQTFVNEDGSLPDLAWFTFDLGKIGLLVQLHSTDRMIEPKRTIKIPSIQNAMAVVTTIDEEHIEGTFERFRQ